jgi:uncharacterized repeat protein (TIGR01451 family)
MLKFLATAVTAICITAAPVAASGLVAEQIIERVVTTKAANGEVQTKLVPADRVIPGEQLVYTLKFGNQGAAAAERVVLTLPIPAEVAYIENSAASKLATVDFSADGGASFALREALTASANGKTRPALAADITHVRWTFNAPVQPKQTGELVFKAVLE